MREIEQSAELVQATPDAGRMLERIARVCYNSENRMMCDCVDGMCTKCVARRDKFLGALKDKRHDSVFEHASATFKIVTDRGITHELVRHRLASFTQSSTRYIKYDDGLPVVKPFGLAAAEEDDWHQAMLAAESAYVRLLENGTAQQDARDVLPTCTAATIFITANFREWRHILNLRLAAGAHPKIRALAGLIWQQFHPLCPVYFEDLAKLYQP
ncbi:MAG: FAD-dependent thymidylate synthase [Planctomycetes bacterium]|nr:FAD-dependent thymidylate synthase [Planctomycetota bacterium]